MIGNCEKAEKDKTSLCERLNAAQSSVLALQQEIKAKEKKYKKNNRLINLIHVHVVSCCYVFNATCKIIYIAVKKI